jgi:hypothetical protein
MIFTPVKAETGIDSPGKYKSILLSTLKEYLFLFNHIVNNQ